MSKHNYIPLDEAKQITGRSDTTLLRWYRAGHVHRRMVRGRPYYHAADLRRHMAALAAKEAENHVPGTQGHDVAIPAQELIAGDVNMADGSNTLDHTSAANMANMFIDQIAELRVECDILRQQLRDKTASQASLILERDRLRVDLRLAQAAQAEAESQHARNIPAFAELRALLDRASADIARVQQQRDQLLVQLQVAEHERDQYQRENEPMRQAIDELETVKAKLLDDLRQITAQMEKQQRQCNGLKYDKEALNAELIWLDDLIKAMLADPLLAIHKGEYQRRYERGRTTGS